MRKTSLFLLIFGLIAIGCDSNDNGDETDAERFEGTWALSSLEDANGPVELDDFESIRVTFNGDESFSLVIDAIDDQADLTLTGTWVVAETSGTLTLTATVPGNPVSLPLTFSYEFDDEDALLTAATTTTGLLNVVLDLSLTAPVTFTVTPV